MKLSRWQRVRTRLFLAGIGLKRRITLGTRVAMLGDNQVYLIRHTYLPGFQLPGGGVEPGETAEQCAGREMEEETGFRPAGPMRLFGLYHNTSSVTNRDHVALFVCDKFSKVHDIRANLEIAEFGWFPLDSLPEQTTPATRQRLKEITGDLPPSPVWGY